MRAFFQHGVNAPRAVHGAVQAMDFVAGGLEPGVQVFDVLRAAALGDEDGVRGVDDDEVADTDGADDAFLALDIAVADVVQDGFAVDAVALIIGGGEIAQRGPGADVAPADGAGHDGDVGRFFHDGVVDGVVRHVPERGGIEFELAETLPFRAARLGDAGAGGVQDGGTVLRHFAQHDAGPKAEHAGVPQEVAGGDVLVRGGKVGFLDEAFDGVALRFDIAIAGFGAIGADAEGDEFALCSELHGAGNSLRKGSLVGDEVIGGEHQQAGIFAVRCGNLQGRSRDGGGGVAPERFEDVAVE